MSFPIIIGAAQYTQPKNTAEPLDPLSLMAKTTRMALSQTETDQLSDLIDAIYMININSWSYEDAPAELSKILNFKPIEKVFLPDGGDTPQMLVTRAAKAIASGKSKAVIITGAEAEYSKKSAKRKNQSLNWPDYKDPSYMEGDLWDGINQFTNKYKFKFPPNFYALLETAVRAKSGRTIEEHRKYMGKLFEHYSKIASNNPLAWSQKTHTGQEITIPASDNRYVSYPYTKLMCANMFVDQAGTVIMTSERVAESLKINKDIWVYLMGSADLKNVHNTTQRPNLHDSPASKYGYKLALEQAGLTLKEIDAFDIYSCFPSIVEIVMNELGLTLDEERDLTLTGGLPYFGGPWSNYSLHAIITAVDLIRNNHSLKLMVIANGGYNSKQSFGIYGKQPPVKAWADIDDSDIQKKILEDFLPEPMKEANGILEVEAYTISYDRDGNPYTVIVIGHLENKRRTVAFIEAQPELIKEFENEDIVGKKFTVNYDKNSESNKIILSK
jgi:acetyl-CoA C-acetyltransferase